MPMKLVLPVDVCPTLPAPESRWAYSVACDFLIFLLNFLRLPGCSAQCPPPRAYNGTLWLGACHRRNSYLPPPKMNSSRPWLTKAFQSHRWSHPFSQHKVNPPFFPFRRRVGSFLHRRNTKWCKKILNSALKPKGQGNQLGLIVERWWEAVGMKNHTQHNHLKGRLWWHAGKCLKLCSLRRKKKLFCSTCQFHDRNTPT